MKYQRLPPKKRLKFIVKFLLMNKHLWKKYADTKVTTPLWQVDREFCKYIAKFLVDAGLISPKTSLIDIHIEKYIIAAQKEKGEAS